MSVEKMFKEMPSQHLKTALVAGLTMQDTLVLVTHKDMDIKTLGKLSYMVRKRISEMKEEASRGN